MPGNCWGNKAALFVLCSALVFARCIHAESTVAPDVLEAAVGKNIDRVAQFKKIAELARRRGLRAYLFGGAAATFVHYVKGDVLKAQGSPDFRNARSDYHLDAMFRESQDLDIVITRADGRPESVDEIRAFDKEVRRKVRSQRGKDAAWEIRGLRTAYGTKAPLADNAEFLNQNSDSQSTALVELTHAPGSADPIVRDLRGEVTGNPLFLADAAKGTIHFFSSPKHAQTARARQGDNPEILSVLRCLRKASQLGLVPDPASQAELQAIAGRFDPSSPQTKYAAARIELEAKKILTGARDLEQAWDSLEALGLRRKLAAFGGHNPKEGSLSWLMNKEPLPRASSGGRPRGRTAGQLGIQFVTHATPSFDAFLSITASPDGAPNAFISRQRAGAGELAAWGDGYYSLVGTSGMSRRLLKSYHILHAVDPSAVEGVDFTLGGPQNEIIVWKNAEKLRVVGSEAEKVRFLESRCLTMMRAMGLSGSRMASLSNFIQPFKGRNGIMMLIPAVGLSVAALSVYAKTWFNTEAQHEEAVALGDTPEEARKAMNKVRMSTYLKVRKAYPSHAEAFEAADYGNTDAYVAVRALGTTHEETMEAVRYGSSASYLNARQNGGAAHGEAMEATRYGNISSYNNARQNGHASHGEAMEAVKYGSVGSYVTLRQANVPHGEAMDAVRYGSVNSYLNIRQNVSTDHAQAMEAVRYGSVNSYVRLRQAGADHDRAMRAVRNGETNKVLRELGG